MSFVTSLDALGAREVVTTDLDYMAGSLQSELATLDGSQLLITGGAGFLGYYLVQSVLHWNETGASLPIHITLLDSFLRGTPSWLSSLTDRRDMRLIAHDITMPLPDNLDSFDYVIHAAGIASPGLYRRLPIETMDANVGGLRRLLDRSVEQARAGRQISGFLFYSSSEIYGDPVDHAIPTPETYRGNVSCTGPRACYDESKRFGETLCVSFAQVHGLPISIARPFNNYGPGMKINDGRVIADFCRAVVNGDDIVILSDGLPTRTFCYVADAVVGYYKCLISGRRGEPYNIGSDGPEVSMAGLAELVAEAGREVLEYEGVVTTGTSADANYLVDNPGRRCPDLSKAKSQLRYHPQIDLDEGIRRTLRWYAGNRLEVGA
jgi:UDP-glucuronate decarboxylase